MAFDMTEKKHSRTSKYNKIGQFNEAIKAERQAYLAAHPRAKEIGSTMQDNINRGRWYRQHSGRLAGLILTSALAAYLSDAVDVLNAATDDTPGRRNYFREALAAGVRGDVQGMNSAMVGGPTEGGLGGFTGQINDRVSAKAALSFATFWESAFQSATQTAQELELRKK
ncbi:MAG: hypothetical protein RMJ88_16360 [Thermogemmata sp.]|nr:hypothetical protein [Thermogemmata sp.]